MHHAPADFERDVVGAPFEDVADLRRAQVARQHLVEQRDRIARAAELKRVALADLDHTLVPAIGAHHRLVDRQRIEELVGEHDQRTVRQLVDRAMP